MSMQWASRDEGFPKGSTKSGVILTKLGHRVTVSLVFVTRGMTVLRDYFIVLVKKIG
jgi:hypothetical protein